MRGRPFLILARRLCNCYCACVLQLSGQVKLAGSRAFITFVQVPAAETDATNKANGNVTLIVIMDVAKTTVAG
jgi:hypothetical protein